MKPPQPRRGGSPRARGWFATERVDGSSRGRWLLGVFLLVACVLSFHLVTIQVVEQHWLAAQAVADHENVVKIPAKRGEIYDSEGDILASDRTVYDIYADPVMIPVNQRSQLAQQLSTVLSMPSAQLTQLLNTPNTQFVYLSKGVSSTVEQNVASLGVSGLGALPSQQRVYNGSPVPGQSFAEPLLGFVDNNGIGQYGVEQYYNKLLSGKSGWQAQITDLQGNPIVLGHVASQPARNGDNLTLGLDSQVQYYAEQAIAQAVVQDQADSGQILVMDTKTGAIKAWAEYPSYNANAYGTTPVKDFVDQAIAGLYEPGSVMKIVTFAGGLKTGAITPQTTMIEGPTTVDGITIYDWDNRAHGFITMQKVLDDSLNDGAIRVEQLTGENAYYANLLAFGIGAPTGVDLSGEQYVPLTPQSTWRALDYAENSFGQEEEVSPVEMLAAINAVANGGVWVQPHAVTSITNPNTGVTTPVIPQSRRVMSQQSAATLGQMMVHVVDDPGAEGFAAQIPGFWGQVAAKTGTAQEPTNGRYQGYLDVSFAGFLPASNPKFTMLVLIRGPRETKIQEFGSTLAGPVWKNMATLMINEWHITP